MAARTGTAERIVIAQNRRARHDYEILETYEAGIVLTGPEIKSIRERKVNLQGAYARIRDGEVWLEEMHIAPYDRAGYTPQDPKRSRKLLLHRREISHLQGLVSQKGLTLIPLSLYLKNGRAKVELGVARGLRKYDKREKIREREQQRQIARHLRHSV